MFDAWPGFTMKFEVKSRELRDEWLPRPFALSPASYYSAPYPGTEHIAAMKAEMSRALKEQAKEKSE